ncbi:MAG: efflux transporter outer membrane subunit [Steroidobacteraceae bacterium]
MSPLARILALSLAVLLAGCAIGPNYRRPVAPSAAAYKELDGWKPSEPADILAHGPWWQIFNDQVLDDLENEIDISNQNVLAAADAAEEARALVREAEASFWPLLSVNAGATHTVTAGGPGVNLKSAGASVDWDIDIWGKIRRTVESEKASAEASAAALANARLTAQADLATDYFELRGQDQLQILLAKTVAADETALKITQARYKAGVAYQADILSAQTELETAQAQAVNAQILRGTLEHAIAVLIGKPPVGLSLQPEPLASTIPTVPPGVPSTLLERRPDIAQAEREVAAANAQIGVAISAFFPDLTLSGSDAYDGMRFGKLIRASNQIWSLGPSLALTLFNGGLRRAELAQVRASYRESVASYRQTVLSDFEQVEDDLVSLRVLEKQATLEQSLVTAAEQDAVLTINQYKAGTVPYSSVITVQTTQLSAEETALSVRIDRFTSSIALIQALGGGWNASQLK